MGRSIDFMDMVVRRKLAPLPETWQVFQWERIGDAIINKGSETRILQKGPRKGKKTWTKEDLRTCIVTDAEIAEEKKNYERDTSKCHECGGDGQEWRGWHHEDGHKFITCTRCGGSGNAPLTGEE